MPAPLYMMMIQRPHNKYAAIMNMKPEVAGIMVGMLLRPQQFPNSLQSQRPVTPEGQIAGKIY